MSHRCKLQAVHTSYYNWISQYKNVVKFDLTVKFHRVKGKFLSHNLYHHFETTTIHTPLQIAYTAHGEILRQTTRPVWKATIVSRCI